MSRPIETCGCQGADHTRACRVGREHARAQRAAEVAAWNDTHPTGSWIDVHPGAHSWRRVQTLGPAAVVVGAASVPVARSLSPTGYLPLSAVSDPTPTRSHADYGTPLTARDVAVWEELVAAHAAALAVARLLVATDRRLSHPSRYGPQAVDHDVARRINVDRRVTEAAEAVTAAQEDAVKFADTVARDLLRRGAGGAEARAWRAVSALPEVCEVWAGSAAGESGLLVMEDAARTLAAVRDLLHADDTRVRASWVGADPVDSLDLADLLRPALATELVGRCRCEMGGRGLFWYEAQAGGAEASFRADVSRLFGRSPTHVFGWDERLGVSPALPSWEDGAP